MNTDWNHVEILEREDYEQMTDSLCYGAVNPCSRVTTFSKLLDNYYFEKAIELNLNVSAIDANTILNKLIGKPYSIVQILFISIRLFFGRLLNFLPYVKLNLTKYLICTELVGIFMQEACGYRFATSPEMLTINEVEEIAIKNCVRFT